MPCRECKKSAKDYCADCWIGFCPDHLDAHNCKPSARTRRRKEREQQKQLESSYRSQHDNDSGEKESKIDPETRPGQVGEESKPPIVLPLEESFQVEEQELSFYEESDQAEEKEGEEIKPSLSEEFRQDIRLGSQAVNNASVSDTAPETVTTNVLREARQLPRDGSLGFEWQVSRLKVNFEGKRVDSKVVLLEKAWAHAESDDGEVEFISGYVLHHSGDTSLHHNESSESFTGKDHVKDCTRRLIKDVQSLHSELPPNKKVLLPGQRIKELDQWTGRNVRIGGEPSTLGKLQVTIGIPLHRLCDLIQTFCHEKIAGCVVEDLEGHKFTSDAARGLLGACYMYFEFFGYYGTLDEKHRVKGACAIMARTDFCSMFKALGADEQKEFRTAVKQIDKEVLDQRLVADGYYAPEKKFMKGPTFGQWLNSITKLSKKKDLMSPPLGFAPHTSGEFNYAMGLYGMVGGLALFEIREFRTQLYRSCALLDLEKAIMPVAEWLFGGMNPLG